VAVAGLVAAVEVVAAEEVVVVLTVLVDGEVVAAEVDPGVVLALNGGEAPSSIARELLRRTSMCVLIIFQFLRLTKCNLGRQALNQGRVKRTTYPMSRKI
jgi:hypothetical protein